jgi:hypothetical protein
MQDVALENAKDRAKKTINELRDLKIIWWKPSTWFKTIFYQNRVLAEAIKLIMNCVENDHRIANIMEMSVATDTQLEQRINRLWSEVYNNEDNRRTLEQRVEVLERNFII